MLYSANRSWQRGLIWIKKYPWIINLKQKRENKNCNRNLKKKKLAEANVKIKRKTFKFKEVKEDFKKLKTKKKNTK